MVVLQLTDGWLCVCPSSLSSLCQLPCCCHLWHRISCDVRTPCGSLGVGSLSVDTLTDTATLCVVLRSDPAELQEAYKIFTNVMIPDRYDHIRAPTAVQW